MGEIKEVHEVLMEWGCITNLIDRISKIEDDIEGGWPELIDMVADAVSQEEENDADQATLFFSLYQFLFRLCYRLRANHTKRPFNKVSKVSVAGEDGFMIENYDYATFKWLRKSGFGDTISNDSAILLIKNLSDVQRRALERKIK